MQKLAPFVLFGSVALAIVVACGSSGNSTFADEDGGGASSGGTSGGTSGSIGSSSGGPGDSGLDKCAAETQAAKQLPLDILVMLDASGSMMQETGAGGTGPTKWASVKSALSGFINDAKSAGIGVGLQIFPIVHAGAPTSCATSADCTAGGGTSYGKCFTKVCVPSSPSSTDPLRACDTDPDCPGSSCARLGQCKSGNIITGNCLLHPVNAQTIPNYGCLFGTCQPLGSATCDAVECFLSDYSTAKVGIAALPGNAGALTSSINGIPDPPPNHMTPTSMAVQGGLDYAKQYAAANPGHVVVMVLATDGFPTRCAPMDIPSIKAIAASGVSGTPSIKTFVIGVFSDDEKAQATTNLNELASGGGTGTAFIVSSTTGNVTTQFQAALDTIRGSALPCDYAVPTPASGTPDFDKVNVEYTTPSGSTVIPYKASPSACDAAKGGWYYNVDPSTGGVPTTITLCPASCDTVKQGGTGAQVQVVLGCKTVVQ